MIRAFLGIELPPVIRDVLRLQQVLLPLPRTEDPGDLHLTLVFLGDCQEPVLEAVHDACATLKETGFSLSLQGFGLFGKERPHCAWAGVAPSPGLIHLQAKVEGIARRAGCRIDSRRFTPHVTLGRFPVPPPDERLRLERAIALGAGFRSDPWPVRDLTLWQSHPGAKSPRYRVLARYPLRPDPPT